MSATPTRIRVLLAASLLLGIASCGGDDAEPTTSTTAATPDTSATSTITAGPTTTASATTAPPTTTTTTAPPATTAAPPSTSSTTLTPVTVTSTTVIATNPIFEITVANGEVKGPGRAKVRLGDVFIVRVVADVADEVHIHGYDRFADVAPGLPAVIEVEALIPGVFEIELEGSGLELLLLEVS